THTHTHTHNCDVSKPLYYKSYVSGKWNSCLPRFLVFYFFVINKKNACHPEALPRFAIKRAQKRNACFGFAERKQIVAGRPGSVDLPMFAPSGNRPAFVTMASGNSPHVANAQVTGNRGCFAYAQHDKG
ncbi:hypothetical protein, partial [Coprobacter tertius]